MSNSQGSLFQMCAAHNPCRMKQMGSTRQDTKHFMFNSEESQGCRTFTHILPLLLPFHQSLRSCHTTQDERGLNSRILPFTLSAELLACHSRSQWGTGLIRSNMARSWPTLQVDHRVSYTAVIQPDSTEDCHTLICLSLHPVAK